MKILSIQIIIITSLLSTITAQRELTSFYFAEAQPPSIPETKVIDSLITGIYHLENDTLNQIIITSDSIYTQTYHVFILSPQDIKKSKGKYQYKNEKLYGIVQNKALDAIQKNDTIYALYPQKDLYFKPSSNTPLKKQNNIYYLNEKSPLGYYTSTILYPVSEGLIFFTLDHDKVMPKIKTLLHPDSTQLEGFKTYIANPTLSSFNKFVEQNGFSDQTKYLKVND